MVVLLVHESVMSEGLFITFILLTTWTLAEFLDRDKLWLLVSSGLMLALSVLTRYVGLVLVPIGGLAILVFDRKGWGGKLKHLLIFGAASVLPVVMWLLRNQLVASTAVNRQVGIHWMAQNLRGTSRQRRRVCA